MRCWQSCLTWGCRGVTERQTTRLQMRTVVAHDGEPPKRTRRGADDVDVSVRLEEVRKQVIAVPVLDRWILGLRYECCHDARRSRDGPSLVEGRRADVGNRAGYRRDDAIALHGDLPSRRIWRRQHSAALERDVLPPLAVRRIDGEHIADALPIRRARALARRDRKHRCVTARERRGDEVDDRGEKGAEEQQQWNRRDNTGARPE